MSERIELKDVHEHMLDLGLGALAHANWHSNYFSHENARWSELSVLQAAHAAEILIKARIAQEHPLLMFESLPKEQSAATSKLEFEHLIENGRTYQWNDLPDRLWGTTGVRLPNIERYRAFGRLRNSIQHFAAPARDVSTETIQFIFEVIDPFIHECWNLYAIDYNEDHEPYTYFIDGLVGRGIRFMVSPDMVKHGEWIAFSWPENEPEYEKEMRKRIATMQKVVEAQGSQVNWRRL